MPNKYDVTKEEHDFVKQKTHGWLFDDDPAKRSGGFDWCCYVLTQMSEVFEYQLHLSKTCPAHNWKDEYGYLAEKPKEIKRYRELVTVMCNGALALLWRTQRLKTYIKIFLESFRKDEDWVAFFKRHKPDLYEALLKTEVKDDRD